MNRKLPFNLEMNQQTANFTAYLILTVMMVCISISWVQLMQWILPRWMRIDILNGTAQVMASQWGFIPYLCISDFAGIHLFAPDCTRAGRA